jgi:ubiquinone/menaquinone biosynthesis C-methylase UbiE
MPFDPDQISRVNRSRDEASAHYDRMSRWYDLLTDGSEKKMRELGLRTLDAHEGEQALVVGFGTGHGVAWLARAVGSTGRVCGIDLSEGMLEVTARRLRDAGLSDRVELRRGDALVLPYAAASFDLIFMSFTLELFDTPEIPKVLAECRRVLKSNGRICVVGMSKHGRNDFMVRLYEWAHRKIPGYVDCRPIFVREALAAAGFRITSAAVKAIWGLPVEIVAASPR